MRYRRLNQARRSMLMKLLRQHVFHLSDIPRDLDSVITIDSKKEVDPREVG